MAKLNELYNQTNEVAGIDLDIVGAQIPNYEGTLKEMLTLVANGTIEPIIQDGIIVGGNCNSGAGDLVTDNLMQKKFCDAYYGKPVMDWMLLGVELKKFDISPDEVINVGGQDYVINYDKKIAIDTTGNVAAQLEDEGMLFPSAISDKLFEMLASMVEETIEEDENELPNEVEVSVGDTPENLIPKFVKKYLRRTYKCCLSADNQMEIGPVDVDGNVTVTNITWGRKLSRSEIAALGE